MSFEDRQLFERAVRALERDRSNIVRDLMFALMAGALCSIANSLKTIADNIP